MLPHNHSMLPHTHSWLTTCALVNSTQGVVEPEVVRKRERQRERERDRERGRESEGERERQRERGRERERGKERREREWQTDRKKERMNEAASLFFTNVWFGNDKMEREGNPVWLSTTLRQDPLWEVTAQLHPSSVSSTKICQQIHFIISLFGKVFAKPKLTNAFEFWSSTEMFARRNSHRNRSESFMLVFPPY